jgi:hypothetical protein
MPLWPVLLLMLGAVVWLALPAAWVGGGSRRWAWPVIVVVLGLWVYACSVAKHWLASDRDTPGRQRVLNTLARTPVRIGLAMLAFPFVVGWMVAFTGLSTGRSGSVLVGIISNSHMGLMVTGMVLMGLSVVRRGEEPRCRACQYDLAGAPDGGYEACPECGADLRASTSIIKGTRRVIVPMIVAGAAIVVVSFASIGLLSRGSAKYMPYLPTGALVKEVIAAPRGFTRHEWAELLTRTLTPAETEALFRGMLDQREANGYMASEAEGWLDVTALAGRVPANAIERYYAGMLDAWLAAPAVVSRREGGSFRFGFGADHRGNISVPSPAVLRVWFQPESLTVDGVPADMVHDPRGPIAGVSMNTTNQRTRGAPRDEQTYSSNGPVGRVDATGIAADEVELRGTGWIAIVPHGSPMTGAVWRRRVDVRKTVRIVD